MTTSLTELCMCRLLFT